MKLCKSCKQPFTQYNTIQALCVPCAIVKGKKKTVKDAKTVKNAQKRELIAAKEAIKTRREWMKEAQQAFNAYIRARDADMPCISCDKPASWNGQWHASHYYATSIRPNLRFNENNVHKACSVCNNYMHGNLTPYRVKLILKIGIELMNILDKDTTPAKYTIQDLKEIKARYVKLKKELDCSMQD